MVRDRVDLIGVDEVKVWFVKDFIPCKKTSVKYQLGIQTRRKTSK